MAVMVEVGVVAELQTEEETVGGGAISPGSRGEVAGEAMDNFVSGETGPAELLPPPVMAPDYDALLSDFRALRRELSRRENFEAEISEVSTDVEKAAMEVLSCESVVEAAKGDLKSARERYDQKVVALRGLTKDFATGQNRLPFDDHVPGLMAPSPTLAPTAEAPSATADAATASTDAAATPESATVGRVDAVDKFADSSIEELGRSTLRELVGDAVFEAAKNSEEPIGLTDRQIETIQGQDVRTIGDLERKLREYPLFLTELRGFGESAQNRLTASLLAWRKVHPMPS